VHDSFAGAVRADAPKQFRPRKKRLDVIMTRMKRDQITASGIQIRQDFAECVRMVFFDTGNASWRYATHGGTCFVVSYRGRPYGFICAHVRQDFEWRQLVITDTKFGTTVARLSAVNYPSQPLGDAVGSDILDALVVRFASDVDVSFFKGSAYHFDAGT
jgi:hypothetical protein